MMAVPMLNRENEVVGILQLINAMSDGRVIPSGWAPEAGFVPGFPSCGGHRECGTHRRPEQAHLDTIFRLGVAAEYRDKETANHIKRMSHYCALIARGLGWSDEAVETILWSSLMHDVGKLGIPDSILQKPGRLTPEERKVMSCTPPSGEAS